jgi:hypothetical protein
MALTINHTPFVLGDVTRRRNSINNLLAGAENVLRSELSHTVRNSAKPCNTYGIHEETILLQNCFPLAFKFDCLVRHGIWAHG